MKIIGYIISIIGLIILLISQFPQFKTALKLQNQLAQIPDSYLTIVGIIIIITGALLIIKGSAKKSKISELPIYKGKDLIGFRRF